MANKKTANTKKDAAAEKISELKAELESQAGELIASAKESAAAKKISIRKAALMVLLLFLAGVGTRTLIEKAHAGFIGWKDSVIQRLIPTPPNPFERKTRPDNNDNNGGEDDGGGIRWKFIRGVAGARPLASWVRRNVPAGAEPSTVYDVADAFYDAADAIRSDPAFDEPAEAVAAVRGRLYGAADAAWVPFLTGLDSQANAYGVESIGDVCEFYYAVAGALYDAAPAARTAPEPLESAAEPAPAANESAPSAAEPERQPPSDPAALPPAEPDSSAAEPEQKPSEPAQTPAKPAQNCPNGSCPNQAPGYNYGGYNYGYNYGWRWF